MEPLFFCPLWGHPESEIESFCARVAEAGFDGVEIYLPVMDNEYRDRVLALFDKHKLQWIAQNAQFYNDAEDPAKKLRNSLLCRPQQFQSGDGGCPDYIGG